MVTGNAGFRTEAIIREDKKTWYRLHPNQTEFDAERNPNGEFGRVMECPNLPNQLQSADTYRKRGFKETPQELMPRAEVVKNREGEYFLVPTGYRLVEIPREGKTPDGFPVSFVDFKVMRGEDLECKVCHVTAKNNIGLISHQKSHTVDELKEAGLTEEEIESVFPPKKDKGTAGGSKNV